MYTQVWKDYYIGQMVKAIGIPNAVGIVIDIYVTDINLCWLKVLWSDLGPPANWERAAWIKPFDEKTDL
tara:strand:+ start:1277 stop:1483 length:207 start_codon:yes stop_codon:yes gene_type:complete